MLPSFLSWVGFFGNEWLAELVLLVLLAGIAYWYGCWDCCDLWSGLEGTTAGLDRWRLLDFTNQPVMLERVV